MQLKITRTRPHYHLTPGATPVAQLTPATWRPRKMTYPLILDFSAARPRPDEFPASADAVIFKATEGTSGVDTAFADNVAWAQAAGKPWAGYHVLVGDAGEMTHLVDTLNPAHHGRVIVWLDDAITVETIRECVDKLLEISDHRHLALNITLAANASMAERLEGWYDAKLANYTSLWVCDWTPGVSRPTIPGGTYNDWKVWQWEDGSSWFNGDERALATWIGPVASPNVPEGAAAADETKKPHWEPPKPKEKTTGASPDAHGKTPYGQHHTTPKTGKDNDPPKDTPVPKAKHENIKA